MRVTEFIIEAHIGATDLVDVYIRGQHRGETITRLVTKKFPNQQIPALIQKLVDKYGINPNAVVYGPSRELDEDQSDYEISNYEKLDNILVKLCEMVVAGKRLDPDTFGDVAACVLDPDNRIVYGTNFPAADGRRYHAERVAMMMYESRYGEIPAGSIIVTTCSPCSEPMDERYGESCTDLINNSRVKKVYCGFDDPTQAEEHRQFNIMETSNSQIRDLCQDFAETFLGNLDESWTKKYKKSIDCSHPRGFSQKAHCAGRRARQAGKHTKSSSVSENFADGKVKGKSRPGRVARAGASCSGSVSSLRAKASKYGGEKGKMYHWCANMKSGRKK